MKTLAFILSLAATPVFAACTPGIVQQDQSAVDLTNEPYLRVLNRPADPAGLSYWTRYLNCGVSISEMEKTLRASSEYRARKN